MFRTRRSGILLGLAAFAAVVAIMFSTQDPAQAQGKGTGTASGLSSVRLAEDPKWRKVIEAGGDAIAQENWKIAIFALPQKRNRVRHAGA